MTASVPIRPLSVITAVYTADIDRLRELMPEKVRNEVQPLQVWPGRGVVALTSGRSR